jgi:hypothetical protein
MDTAELTPASPTEQSIGQAQQGVEPAVPQQPQPEDETEQISEMVGVAKPWEKVDLYLDNWEYRVWEGWMGGKGIMADKQADLLVDVLKQFDNNATVVKGPSKSDANAMTYSFKFSLGGDPDGVVDAITKINQAFIALDNYKVVSGKMYAIVYYADGEENTMDLTPQLRGTRNEPKGVDINDAVEMALDAVTKGHAPESQWKRPKACPECGEQLPNSNDAIAQHYADYHPDKDIGNVYKEEATDDEEWAKWMSGLPGATTTDLDETGRPLKRRTPPINPEDLQKKDEGRWDYREPDNNEGRYPGSPGSKSPPPESDDDIAWHNATEDISKNRPKVYPPKPTAEDWAKTVKPESGQFCKYCGSPIDQEGWTVCSKCITDINAGEQPGGSHKPLERVEEIGPQMGPQGKGMPDLTYRQSPMGVESTHTEAHRPPKAIQGELPVRTQQSAGKDLPGTETTEFDSMGRPIVVKWEDEAIGKVEKILHEVEDIYSEHEFYVRIRDMLNELASVMDMIVEEPASPTPSEPVQPQVQPHVQSQEIGPSNDVNKQESVKDPSGGKPHNYTQGKMGQCAICGLPATHYSHIGY